MQLLFPDDVFLTLRQPAVTVFVLCAYAEAQVLVMKSRQYSWSAIPQAMTLATGAVHPPFQHTQLIPMNFCALGEDLGGNNHTSMAKNDQKAATSLQ